MKSKNEVKQYLVAKGGIRINGVKFINKTHNTPSITDTKHISKTFNQNAPVMEAYIPKADMETIDIGANDYRLLSNNYIVDSRPFPWSYYDGSGNPLLYLNLLRKYGADPTKVGNKIYTKNRAVIPLRDETWPDMPQQARLQIDQIIEEGKKVDLSLTPLQWDLKATQLNLRANDILSNNGKKVIKYTNVNPSEVHGGDGTSFIVTDPSVFYNVKSTARQRYMPLNLTKYPFTYGISRLNLLDLK